MKRLKKMIHGVSFAFATVVFVLMLALTLDRPVYATQNPDNQQQTNDTVDQLGQLDNNGQNGATSNNNNGISVNWGNDEGNFTGNLKILLMLTIIALAPSILIMLTSFTRIIIVLHFTRTAIGTQTAPPNQVLIGLALFLTWFIMNPIFTQINDTALKPLDAGEIQQEEALERGMIPLREFMESQTQTSDLNLFCDIAKIDSTDKENIPLNVLIPSFILSELRTSFIIGFLIYIPFIVIDMVVASVLMSMGMMMLPPTTISMPFKILLFILADGWDLVIGSLVKTFY